VVASDLFLTPNSTNHRAFSSTTIGTEPFTDLDFANDVALVTEMLSLLILALEIMNHQANVLGIQVNWYKTKIQTTNSSFPLDSYVPMVGDNVKVIKSFT